MLGLVGAFCHVASSPSLLYASYAPVCVPAHVLDWLGARQVTLPAAQ